jgi:hypothetical protein
LPCSRSLNWMVADVIDGPGATELDTRRVAPQPAEITAAVIKTLSANFFIGSSSRTLKHEKCRSDTAQATVTLRQ